MWTKLLLIGIAVSSLLVYSGCSSDEPPELSVSYRIYVNQTDNEILIKRYNTYYDNDNGTLFVGKNKLESQDSLIFRNSDSLYDTDSVIIIFNDQKILKYHRDLRDKEKYSIYDTEEYQKVITENFAKRIYTFTNKHLDIAQDMPSDE